MIRLIRIAVLSAGRIAQAIGACTCLVGARGMVRERRRALGNARSQGRGKSLAVNHLRLRHQ